MCAKRDVNRAFKWHHVKSEDTPEFATSLPGGPLGLRGDVVLIYGVMAFGWTGSPGEYMIYSWAAKLRRARLLMC